MAEPKREKAKPTPVCFVIMPISDVDGYEGGHFRRVYDHLIVPACREAGFEPLLASDVKEANMIVIDVLQRLYTAEMVLCDLSSRNPNVLFELGFRQAFSKPVTLIKDLRTERIFDISGLRDIPYDESLRIDVAHATIAEIADRMKATCEAAERGSGGVNSLVQLLGVEAAVIPERAPISNETQLVLDAVRDLSDRVRALESPSEREASVTRKRSNSGRGELELHVMGSAESREQLIHKLNSYKGLTVIRYTAGEEIGIFLIMLHPALGRVEAEQLISQAIEGTDDIRVLILRPI